MRPFVLQTKAWPLAVLRRGRVNAVSFICSQSALRFRPILQQVCPVERAGIRRRISPWSRGDNDKGKLELSNSRQALKPAVLYMTTDNERPVATIHPDMSKINFLDANLAKTCLYT